MQSLCFTFKKTNKYKVIFTFFCFIFFINTHIFSQEYWSKQLINTQNNSIHNNNKGGVGIGITNPLSPLHINREMLISGISQPPLIFPGRQLPTYDGSISTFRMLSVSSTRGIMPPIGPDNVSFPTNDYNASVSFKLSANHQNNSRLFSITTESPNTPISFNLEGQEQLRIRHAKISTRTCLVGIGTHDPQEKLHVAGRARIDGKLLLGSGGITFSDGTTQTTTTLKGDTGDKGDKGDTGDRGRPGPQGNDGAPGRAGASGFTLPQQIYLGTDVDGNGQIRTFTSNLTHTNVHIGTNPSSLNGQGGSVLVSDNSFITPTVQYAKAGIYVDAFGSGIVTSTVKQFRVTNPKDPKTDIVYSSVEGPEAAAYIRGTGKLIDGVTTIAFPDHFIEVISLENKGLTIQLTPLSAVSKGIAVTEKSREGFKVQELNEGKGSYEFDWEVKAIRKGYENYKVIMPKILMNQQN